MTVLDYDPPAEKKATDWSGTIIGAMLLPVLFFFIYIGKAELGFTACIVSGMSILAVRLHWKLRKHGWFWATVALIAALQVPLILIVRWPQTNIPTIVYSLPLGILDFLLIMGTVGLAQRIFLKGSSSDDDE